MAGQQVLGQMIVKIVGENAEFDQGIDNSEKKLDSFQNTITKIAGAAGLVLLSRKIIEAGKSALQSAGQMQMYEASFTTMLGSATKAKSFMNDIVAMAAKTPFQTEDLADASKTLMQFGVASKDLLPTMKMLGDIAQGNNQRFNSLALVFGQMKSAGRLMGQDLLQMINAGFNPLQEISKKTGESMAVLKDKMSKGAISADMVTEAFRAAASEGGKFFNGMEVASKTLPGLMSTLTDNVSIMSRSFTEELMPVAMNTVKWLSEMTGKISELSPAIKSFVVVMGGGVVVATALAGAIKGIGLALNFLKANPLIATIAGIALLTTTLIALKHASDVQYIQNGFKDVEERLKNSVTQGNKVESAIIKIASETGLAVSKVAELAQKAGLVKEETEAIIENLKNINKEGDKEKDNAKAIMMMNDRISKNLQVDFSVSAKGARDIVKEIASEYNVSIDRVIALGLSNKTISKEHQEQLKILQKQVDEENKIVEGRKDLARSTTDDGKQQAEMAAKKKAADDEALVRLAKQEADYKLINDNLVKQLSIIDERSKVEKIENIEDEKKKAVIESINKLIDMGYKVEGANIDTIMKKYSDLFKIKKENADVGFLTSGDQSEASIRFIEGGFSAVSDNIKTMSEESKISFGDIATFSEVTNEELVGNARATSAEIYAAQKEGIDKKKESEKKSLEETLSLTKSVVDTTIGIVTDANKQTASNMVDTVGDFVGAVGGPVGKVINIVTDVVAAVINAYEKAKEKALEYENEVSNIQVKVLNNKIKANDEALQSTLDTIEEEKKAYEGLSEIRLGQIDAEEKAAIEAAGVAEDTQQQIIQKRIDKLNEEIVAETDTAKKKELIDKVTEETKALTRQKIEDEYDIKRAQAEKDIATQKEEFIKQENIAKEAAAKIDRQLQHDKAVLEQTIALNSAEIERIKAISSLGWFNKDKKAQVNSLFDELIASIKGLPIPTADTGGLANPPPGGMNIRTNVPELFIPLDRLDQFLSKNFGASTSGEGGMTHLIVNIDSKPILDKIFPATRNHTVLIDQGAVV